MSCSGHAEVQHLSSCPCSKLILYNCNIFGHICTGGASINDTTSVTEDSGGNPPGQQQQYQLELLHRHYTDLLLALLKQHFPEEIDFGQVCRKLRGFFDSLKEVVRFHETCLRALNEEQCSGIVKVVEVIENNY